MDRLHPLGRSAGCSLYEIRADSPPAPRRYLVSTPETRTICNDPTFVGLAYTSALRKACKKTLRALARRSPFPFNEPKTTVLHILRGGLNFGLREALHEAFGWNRHGSAFISAQRARTSGNMEDWHITEGSYQKVYLSPEADIIFGDVVATGTSLEYALHELLALVQREGVSIRSVLFFTIGGIRAEQILQEVDRVCRDRFPGYLGAATVYFEGRFGIAFPDTDLRIKVPGTDLLRKGGLYAPEFLESQYAKPTFPLERCAIYDAGSRAFWLPEYTEDVWDYWEQTLWLSKEGVGFADLLRERAPDLDPARFGRPSLEDLCRDQLAACENLLIGMERPKPAFKRE